MPQTPQAFFDHLAAQPLMRRLIELAADEDLGPAARDITSDITIDPTDTLTTHLTLRQPAHIAGLAAIPLILDVFAARGFTGATFTPLAYDAQSADTGATLGVLAGNARAVLAIERTMLNLVGRLSGIATLTATYAAAIGDAPAKLCDTRKTTPGLRHFEKYAVRCGGGHTHRMGLHDAVLIKDNHIAHIPDDQIATWLAKRIDALRRSGASPTFIECEVDSLDTLGRILRAGSSLIDIVLLDNMPPAQLAEAVAMRNQHAPGIQLEASGGVTLETIGTIASTGVDRISVGALTHQAVSVDIGLDAVGGERG